MSRRFPFDLFFFFVSCASERHDAATALRTAGRWLVFAGRESGHKQEGYPQMGVNL
jgi:hypothetical protein